MDDKLQSWSNGATGYRVITLNRPQRLNAFNEPMQRALAVARSLTPSATESCRALLLTGTGRAFSSGQDLNERITAAGDVVVPGDALREILQSAGPEAARACRSRWSARSTASPPAPRCNIALACDIVLAARSASFLQPFARLGLVPDAGGTWLLPRLVGQARARGLALLAEPLSAEKAEQWGLIWKVVDDAALMPEAREALRAFRHRADIGLALIKRALDAAEDNDLSTQLDLERDLQRRGRRASGLCARACAPSCRSESRSFRGDR